MKKMQLNVGVYKIAVVIVIFFTLISSGFAQPGSINSYWAAKMQEFIKENKHRFIPSRAILLEAQSRTRVGDILGRVSRFDVNASELSLMKDYINSSFPYNQYLRLNHNFGGIDKLSEDLDTGLAKLTDYKGISYRNQGLSESYLAELSPGDVVADRGFSSSSYDLSLIREEVFYQKDVDRSVLVKNFLKSGKPIGDTTKVGGVGEVVSRPNTRFSIKAIAEVPHPNNQGEFLIIREEVGGGGLDVNPTFFRNVKEVYTGKPFVPSQSMSALRQRIANIHKSCF